MSSFKTGIASAAVAALALVAPAAALADNPGDHGQSSSEASHGQSKAHFTANGKITAVGTDSFTMHVKGGSKDLHGTDVTVTVTDTTKVRRNGAKASVADLQVGDRVNANGARGTDGTFTARHVNAHGPDSSDSSSSDSSTSSGDASGDGSTPTPDPSDSPSPSV